jgi:hypothetical protein
MVDENDLIQRPVHRKSIHKMDGIPAYGKLAWVKIKIVFDSKYFSEQLY